MFIPKALTNDIYMKRCRYKFDAFDGFARVGRYGCDLGLIIIWP